MHLAFKKETVRPPDASSLQQQAHLDDFVSEFNSETLLYRRKVANLHQVLQDETTRQEPVEIIRSLIDRIEIRPGPARGRCEVAVVGALAQILAFAHQRVVGSASPGKR
jgi:hypothetical protein